MPRLHVLVCVFGDCRKWCGVESERDEAGEVGRTHALMGLECHSENRGFYAEGTGEPWRDFEQRRDRVRVEY